LVLLLETIAKKKSTPVRISLTSNSQLCLHKLTIVIKQVPKLPEPGLKAPEALEAHSLRVEEAELGGLEKNSN